MSQSNRLTRIKAGPSAYAPIPLVTAKVADVSDETKFPNIAEARRSLTAERWAALTKEWE